MAALDSVGDVLTISQRALSSASLRGFGLSSWKRQIQSLFAQGISKEQIRSNFKFQNAIVQLTTIFPCNIPNLSLAPL